MTQAVEGLVGSVTTCFGIPAQGLCGPQHLLQRVAVEVMAVWPLWIVLALVALLVVRARRRARTRRREFDSVTATFFEIIPPVRLPAEGARPLWSLLASQLARDPRLRLSLEFWCTGEDGQVHAGLWVPRGDSVLSAQALARSVAVAWPGAGVVELDFRGTRPWIPAAWALGAVEVAPRDGAWSPIVDHEHTPARGAVAEHDEPLRAALAHLSELGEAGISASIQVIVSRSRHDRSASTVRAHGARLGRRMLLATGQVTVEFLRELISVLQPGPRPSAPSSSASSSASSPARASHTTTSPTRASRAATGPGEMARQRAVEAKRRHGPHLRTTVRVLVAGTTSRIAAHREARSLASSLYALTLDPDTVTTRRVRGGPAREITLNREHGRGFIASTRELAAIWHLPHDAARHGLPRPHAVHRAPDRALPRLEHDDSIEHATPTPSSPSSPSHALPSTTPSGRTSGRARGTWPRPSSGPSYDVYIDHEGRVWPVDPQWRALGMSSPSMEYYFFAAENDIGGPPTPERRDER